MLQMRYWFEAIRDRSPHRDRVLAEDLAAFGLVAAVAAVTLVFVAVNAVSGAR